MDTVAVKRFALSAISIVVAMAATWVWWHVFDVSLSDVRALGGNLDWRLAVPIGLLLLVHVALSAWRWSLIELSIGGTKPKYRDAFTGGLLAMGLGTFLPAPAMNIACRSLTNKINGKSGTRGAISGTLDQLADFTFTAWLAIPAAIALIERDPRFYFWGAPIMAALGFLALSTAPSAVQFVSGSWSACRRANPKLLLNRDALTNIYCISALRLLNLTAITLCVHFACGAATVSSLTVSVPPVTIAIAVTMLPGSIGSAEWSFAASLARQSIGSGAIVTFVLANRILLTILPVLLAVTVLPVFAVIAYRKKNALRSKSR